MDHMFAYRYNLVCWVDSLFFFFLLIGRPRRLTRPNTLFPYTTRFRSRPGAVASVAALRRRGYALGIIAGDTPDSVMPVAAALGIDAAQSGLLPTEKTARLASLATAGRKALMVGDGIHAAPGLVAAHVGRTSVVWGKRV